MTNGLVAAIQDQVDPFFKEQEEVPEKTNTIYCHQFPSMMKLHDLGDPDYTKFGLPLYIGETLTEMLNKKIPMKDFWKNIDENEKTHLITRSERDKKEYLYINIPIEGGYFLNKTVGFEYGKKEELYLKYISQYRIRWKKMKLESKKKEIEEEN